MAKKTRKGPKTLADKVADMDRSFYDEVQGLGVDQIKNKIMGLAISQAEMEEAKEKDEDYQKLRDQLKYAAQGYREHSKAVKLKTKYLMELKASKGG